MQVAKNCKKVIEIKQENEKEVKKENELKDSMWNKAKIIPGTDSTKYRKDICGNMIFYDYYRVKKFMGWFEKFQGTTVNKNKNDPDNFSPHISIIQIIL